MSDFSDMDLIKILFDDLKKQRRVVYFNSARTEMMTRCVYCGDSVNNETHAHLYISTKSPFQFFCQRCNHAGMLSSKVLHDINFNDVEGVSRVFDKKIRKALKNTTIRLGRGKDPFSKLRPKYKLPKIDENFKFFEKKIIYLEDRFDIDLDTADLERMKVIFDYRKFIKDNNIKNMIERMEEQDFYYYLIKHVQCNSIAFQTSDGNYNIIRHISPYKTPKEPKGRRYHNDNVNYPVEIGDKTYTIANGIDMTTPTLNLVLTEGIMDINSVFLNIHQREQDEKTLFMAVNGKAFNLPILNLRRLGFLNMNLDIYSDNDVNKNVYRKILDFSHFNSIRLHYNEKSGEKDFGVPLSKIKERRIILK
ncbi:hypothetical protein [Proteus mirabilis]|uniref:hypothetical protein n=1 Tax=Proteus mirabilis TaxID=584 RepID=UPI0034D3BF44